jgi:hypothetical protein
MYRSSARLVGDDASRQLRLSLVLAPLPAALRSAAARPVVVQVAVLAEGHDLAMVRSNATGVVADIINNAVRDGLTARRRHEPVDVHLTHR